MSRRDKAEAGIDPLRRSLVVYRVVVATLFGYLGLCEVLATSDFIDWDAMPIWLAMPVAVTGFFGVIGLASFLGNGVMAVGVLFIVWRRWDWPLWGAALLSLPFWIITYRLSPKPW